MCGVDAGGAEPGAYHASGVPPECLPALPAPVQVSLKVTNTLKFSPLNFCFRVKSITVKSKRHIFVLMILHTCIIVLHNNLSVTEIFLYLRINT